MYLVDIQQYSARSSYWPYEHKNELPLKLAYTLRHRVKPDGSKEYYSYSGSGYATWRESEERKGTLIEDRSIFFDLYAVFENGLEKEWS